MNEKCPKCESKKYLSSLDLTPDVLEEMALEESILDFVGEEIYRKRLDICSSCPYLISGMTCAHCGCFVQLRSRHKTSACIMGKW